MREHYFGPLVEASRAWTVMLVDTGIVARATGASLLDALGGLRRAGAGALGEFNPAHEYFYSHMEHYLGEHAGPEVAGEINIGRTRPEPLARMATRERVLDTLDLLASLRGTLLDLAEREAETVMPQWTHFQHAQPSTLGHYALGMADALGRDAGRLAAAYATANASTLGCGALAGSSYPLDRELVAELLGFDEVRLNTLDCVASADYLTEAAAALAGTMVTLSRLCEDLYVWHTEEFDFVVIGDEYAGSSSMMPQKKNPYPFEYVRARAAQAVGDAASALGVLHNTNFQDLKDVEEEVVHPVFRSFRDAGLCLRLLEGSVASLEWRREAMLERAGRGFAAATELAARIHRGGGLSYRTAHRIVGNLVLRAVTSGRGAREVDAELLDLSADEVIGRPLGLDDAAVRAALDPVHFVRAHNGPGGPAPAAVGRALLAARERLERDSEAVAARRAALADAHARLESRVAGITA
jgi:argininosuccinate lyase